MVPRLVPDTRYPDIAPDEEIMEEEEGEDGVKVMARSIYRSDKLQEVIKDIKVSPRSVTTNVPLHPGHASPPCDCLQHWFSAF